MNPFNMARMEVGIRSWLDFCQHVATKADGKLTVTTATGRTTDPLPAWQHPKSLAVGTKQYRLLKCWLFEEAIMEALHRQDKYNLTFYCASFKREFEKANQATRSEIGEAYQYLFNPQYVFKPMFTDKVFINGKPA